MKDWALLLGDAVLAWAVMLGCAMLGFEQGVYLAAGLGGVAVARRDSAYQRGMERWRAGEG